MNLDVVILGIITFLGTVIAFKTMFKILAIVIYKTQRRKIKSII